MDISFLSFTLDWERFLFVAITLIVYAVTAGTLPQLFRISTHNRRFLVFYILTFFATLGVFFSADLFTTFCFFEMMTLFSFAYVANDETKYAQKAALSYLAYGIAGGLVMLFGILVLYNRMGTLNYELLRDLCYHVPDKSPLYLPGACLLFGFGAKAGMFPLHTWLTKTYVAAPCAGTTVLSAVLSKTGIFGIYMITFSMFQNDKNWGMVMTVLGCLTMLTGGILALFSVNLKRTLACSSMSQIGFILVAIAAGDSIAAMFHTVNHSLFKLLLFTVVSSVYGMTKELDYNKLAGYANGKKRFLIPFVCAALSMSGFPLLSGYVSKTSIHTAIEEVTASYFGSYTAVEWIFLISGGMTLAYMLKLFFALFCNHAPLHASEESNVIPKNTCYSPTGAFTTFSLFVVAALCTLPGLYFCFPPLAPVSSLVSLEALSGSLISLSIGALITLLIVRPFLCVRVRTGTADGNVSYTIFKDCYPAWLDLEQLVYIPVFIRFLPFVCALLSRLADRLVDGLSILAMKTIFRPNHHSHIKNEHPLAYLAGKIADGIFYLVHVKLLKRPAVSRASYADLFTVGSTEFSRTTRLILYSVSFGLLMFSLGLMVALIYLLLAL